MANSGISRLSRIAAAAWLASLAVAAHAGSSRLEIFISDTHFGVGKNPDGTWNNFEDARWPAEFSTFLKEMDRLGKGKADLILNGDTLELWQSLDPKDCIDSSNKNLGCNEAGALKRLERVLDSHRPELQAIKKFATSGDNSVFVVPGNHDVALMFPAVAKEFLKAIGAPVSRIRIETKGYWLSPDQLIYAEHGQQIGEEVNKFDKWPRPFLSSKDGDRLQRPWGEQFVQQFYNAFEAKYPIIDNFSEDSIGVKYAYETEGLAAMPKEFGKFVWFYLTKLSWQQVLHNLGGDPDAPEWDLTAVRMLGDHFLVESIPTSDPLRKAAEQQFVAGDFGQTVASLSDDDLTNICNLRKQTVDENRQAGVEPTVGECPNKNLGAVTQKLLSSRNKVFTNHLDRTFDALTQAKLTDEPFLLFVYSHTHLADDGFYPLLGSGRNWNPLVVNTGAWQRTINPTQLESIEAKRLMTDKDVLLKLKPEDLPACYPAILVEPYINEPHSVLRYWRISGDTWNLGETCGDR